jgi:hypothetical protein
MSDAGKSKSSLFLTNTAIFLTSSLCGFVVELLTYNYHVE